MNSAKSFLKDETRNTHKKLGIIRRCSLFLSRSRFSSLHAHFDARALSRAISVAYRRVGVTHVCARPKCPRSLRMTPCRALVMRMRRWKPHRRRGCFPTGARWLRGASFGAGFTAHAGDTGTETRFLVDDPAATNTTYTKEGEL